MPGRMSHFWRYQFPALAWGTLIFLASSVPATKLPPVFLLAYDKLIHLIIFLVLEILVYRAIAPRAESIPFSLRRLLLSLGIVVLYGVIDELHQAWVPGRWLDIRDLLADTVGGTAGALCIFLYEKWSSRRVSRPPG